MFKSKKVLILLAVMLLTVMLSGCGGSAAIGVVDTNKINESPKIKALSDQLSAKGKELMEQLEKDKTTMSPEDFQKRQEAVIGDFMKMKQELGDQAEASVKQALEQVQNEKKLGAILHKGGVAQGGVDVTDDVLKKLQ